MACHSEGSEGAEVATVVERDQAERNDDQQNRFLVDMPAEEERGVSAESGSCHEYRPCRSKEELDECRLKIVVSTSGIHQSGLKERGLQSELQESG